MITRCPSCENVSRRYIETTDRNRKISERSFIYYKCPSCRLIFLHPIPDELSEYYPGIYYTVPESLETLAKNAEGDRYKIELVRRFVDSGRLLEIGPAYGGFAYLAKQAGFDVEAIEMDSRCCQFLNDTVGIKTINSGDVVAALAGMDPYNVIVLWHVIEHLPDPWAVIDAASERLLPGGIAVVASPNPDSLQFRMFGRFWAHVDAPRHLFLIPPRLLAARMDARGLETVVSTTTDAGSLYWNLFGWQTSLSNFASGATMKAVLRLAGGVLCLGIRPLERRRASGSAYTMIFRRKTIS